MTHYDAVVVGSGFGGAVTAARLSQRGFRVLVLERGPWWGPSDSTSSTRARRGYPRSVRSLPRLVRSIRWQRGRRDRELVVARDGLFEAHIFDHLTTVAGSGVGGGSLVYAGFQTEPPESFYRSLPDGLDRATLADHLAAFKVMQRPTPVPGAAGVSERFDRAVGEQLDAHGQPPEVAVTFTGQPTTNPAAIAQVPCVECGECALGCNHRAKNTLDLTYLPLALVHGADIRPLSEVTALASTTRGYEVFWTDHLERRTYSLEAPTVVLAAGTMNTLRLLYVARDRHRSLPSVSQALGHGFSANGDFLTLAYDSPHLEPIPNVTVRRMALAPDKPGRPQFIGHIAVPTSALPMPAPLRKRLDRSAFVFTTGDDGNQAPITYDSSRLRTATGRDSCASYAETAQRTGRDIATEAFQPATIRSNFPLAKRSRGMATVHPVGGAALSDDPAAGVTDRNGQVHGHPGLYIADGSLLPAPPAVPPSVIIGTLAEHVAANIN